MEVFLDLKWAFLLLSAFFAVVVTPGLALFQSNILQYGRDQLDFASSEILSSFVFWYYWSCYLLPGIAFMSLS